MFRLNKSKILNLKVLIFINLIIMEWLIYKMICLMDLVELLIKIKYFLLMDNLKMDKFMGLTEKLMKLDFVKLLIKLMD